MIIAYIHYKLRGRLLRTQCRRSGEIGAPKKIKKLVQGFLRYIRSTTTHASGDGAVELVSREIVEFS